MASKMFEGAGSVEEVCKTMEVDDLVEFAKTCEAAERYDDMVTVVKSMARSLNSSSAPMSVEQRNLFSVAYKNVVGAIRASWRVLDSVRGGGSTPEESKFAERLQSELEDELVSVCSDLLSLVNRPAEDVDGQVFFAKMAGDYNRYMAEVKSSKGEGGTSKYAEAAKAEYEKAQKLAKDGGMHPTSPIYLGLALNFSVFHYEILQSAGTACDLAKAAFDGAISELDSLAEEEYKDCTLIMQLIRDNLTLWQSTDAAPAPEDDGTAVEDL